MLTFAAALVLKRLLAAEAGQVWQRRRWISMLPVSTVIPSSLALEGLRDE